MENEETKKQFFTIGELSKEFGITPRALRFYEEKGILCPLREGQTRKYTQRDRVHLIFVMRGKRIGLSLDLIKQIADLYHVDGGVRQLELAIGIYKKQIRNLERQRIDIEEQLSELRANTARFEDLLAKELHNNKNTS